MSARQLASVDDQMLQRQVVGLIGAGVATRKAIADRLKLSLGKVQAVLDRLRATKQIHSTGVRRGMRWHVGKPGSPAKEGHHRFGPEAHVE